MGLLARREHARRELADKLRLRGFEAAAIETTLDGLAERGWLDEGRYAESYARSRVERAYGPLRITAELQQRGIDRATIGAALAPHEGQWLAVAERALRHRFGGAIPDDRDAQRRYRGFLLRRGFTGDQVARLLRDRDDC